MPEEHPAASSARDVVRAVVVAVVCAIVAGTVAFACAGPALLGTTNAPHGAFVDVAGVAVPLLVLLAGVCFAVNLLAFIPAYALHTERFYDLTGSLTFITVTTTAIICAPSPLTLRGQVAAVMVLVWTIRLGSFLFRRVMHDGGDGRFDTMKYSAPRFVIAWTLQGLWVFLTALPALMAITSPGADIDVALVIGAVVWLCGFSIEVVADRQKRVFRRDPAMKGRFIQTGLWRFSRHPNYFGEITLWVGVTILASSTFVGLQWVAVISPIFVAVLLTQISGIPLLTERAEARFGSDPEYRAYVARTSLLVPWPRRRPAQQ